MLAAFDVGVGQLVDQDDLRFAREDAVDIHLLKEDALVVDFLSRYFFELFGQLCGARAAVCLDDPDHDVLTSLAPADRLAEHVVGLADAGRVAEEEFEGAAGLLRRDLFQPFFWALCCRVRDFASAHKDKIK
jgi:hypothetical protein